MKNLLKIHTNIYVFVVAITIILIPSLYFLLNMQIESSVDALIKVSEIGNHIYVSANDMIYINSETYLVFQIKKEYYKAKIFYSELSEDKNHYIITLREMEKDLPDSATLPIKIIYDKKSVLNSILENI